MSYTIVIAIILENVNRTLLKINPPQDYSTLTEGLINFLRKRINKFCQISLNHRNIRYGDATVMINIGNLKHFLVFFIYDRRAVTIGELREMAL